jgi:predicted amidophosphoribosyltransferase
MDKDVSKVCWVCKNKSNYTDDRGKGFCSECKAKFDKKLPKGWDKVLK